jgi:hypothetical protein
VAPTDWRWPAGLAGDRDAKLRTLLDTVPEVAGRDGTGLDLRWTGLGGAAHRSGLAVLVSNNRYRLGSAVGSGTRPRIDDGLLGITVVDAPLGREPSSRPQRMWRELSAPRFEVPSDPPVPAGIDGEAATLAAPLRFRIRPGRCGSAGRKPTPAGRPPPRFQRARGMRCERSRA